MTLVLGIMSRNTLWVMADRRLTWPDGEYRDDAMKLMNLETVDGSGTLVYAGLGVTANGTEPSQWMSNVLRGRNLTFKQSLAVLAEVANVELRGIPKAATETVGSSSTTVPNENHPTDPFRRLCSVGIWLRSPPG